MHNDDIWMGNVFDMICDVVIKELVKVVALLVIEVVNNGGS